MFIFSILFVGKILEIIVERKDVKEVKSLYVHNYNSNYNYGVECVLLHDHESTKSTA